MSILKLKDSQGNWISVPTLKGDKGNGIQSAVLNNDYTLTLTFTDGTTYTTPSIRGEKGEQGEPATDMEIHICSASEYDPQTRIPTIAQPDDKTFYLVPTVDGTSPDLFTEWVYVNNAWGMFGSASVDLSGYLTDVQINGTSIVSDGVANVPIASATKLGAIKVSTGLAINNNGSLYVRSATDAYIKQGTNTQTYITPQKQHSATFYGLAKSAGDTTQSQSSNAVGNYTDEAKIAIQKMLGIYEPPWELIEDFTLEEAGTIDKVTEPDGTPYNFLQVFIKITIPPNSEAPSSGYGLYYFYDENNQNIVAETGRYAQNTAQMFKHVFFQKSKNMAMVTFTRSTSIGSYAMLYNKYQGVGVEFGNVHRVRSVGPEPAGTQIQIYAQRAY